MGRREDLREAFEVVTSRSFGPPAITAESGAAFLKVEGWMVVSEPPETAVGDRWPALGLREVGLSPAGAIRVNDRFGYQLLHKEEQLSDRYPRRVGIPSKRPLF